MKIFSFSYISDLIIIWLLKEYINYSSINNSKSINMYEYSGLFLLSWKSQKRWFSLLLKSPWTGSNFIRINSLITRLRFQSLVNRFYIQQIRKGLNALSEVIRVLLEVQPFQLYYKLIHHIRLASSELDSNVTQSGNVDLIHLLRNSGTHSNCPLFPRMVQKY